jgi:hypothetical protein
MILVTSLLLASFSSQAQDYYVNNNDTDNENDVDKSEKSGGSESYLALLALIIVRRKQ